MRILRKTIQNILLESIGDSFRRAFYNHPEIEILSRMDVPDKELLSKSRNGIYIAIREDDCICLSVLEERDYYHIIYQQNMKVLYVHSLRTYPGQSCQGRGLGTRMKLAINQVADSQGIHLVSHVAPYGSDKMTTEVMVDFNKRFGFKPIKEMIYEYVGTDEDEAWEVADSIWGGYSHGGVEMYRSPKGFRPPPPSGIIPSKELYEEEF